MPANRPWRLTAAGLRRASGVALLIGTCAAGGVSAQVPPDDPVPPPVADRSTGPADAGVGAVCDATRWLDLLRHERRVRPAGEIADLYKLLFQATLGSEHAVPDRATAEAWLADELAELPEGGPEPVADTLGMGGRYARVNLRPYLAIGGDPARLLDAFVATARTPAEGEHLPCALSALETLAREGALPWDAETVGRYVAARAEEGYVAVHHSEAYGRAYGPAYRVVSVSRIEALLHP